MTKVCKKCGRDLPVENFQKHDAVYRMRVCKECLAEARKVEKPKYTQHELNTLTNTCIRCGEEKTLFNFSKAPSNASGYRNYCKVCDAEMRRDKRQATRKKVQDFKTENKCIKCGEDRFYVLDFHHRDPKTKSTDVSKLMDSGYNGKLWAEIGKTVILCRNCHATFHHLERTEGMTLEKYLQEA